MENFVSDSKIRIKDIAKIANVSVGTVDRVLHNRGEVSIETRELVNRIIHQMGYKPNMIASSLAKNKQHILAAFMPAIAQVKNDAREKGILMAVDEMKDYNVSFEPYYYDNGEEEESFFDKVYQLIQKKPAGILFEPCCDTHCLKALELFQLENIPVVLIQKNISTPERDILYTPHHYQSGYIAAKLMSLCIPQSSMALIITLNKNKYNEDYIQKRIQGFKAFYLDKKISETTIRSIEIPSCTDDELKKILTQTFLDYSFVRGIYVTGSEVWKIAKFKEEKKLGNIRLIGYDLNSDNIRYLKKEQIDFLIHMQDEQQYYESFRTLFKKAILKKEILSGLYHLPVDIITPENIDLFNGNQ